MVSFQKTLPKERNHLEKDIKYSLIVKRSPKSNSLSKVIVQKKEVFQNSSKVIYSSKFRSFKKN